MASSVGVGLVGAGWIGRLHAQQFLRLPQLGGPPGVEIRLRAVADVMPAAARALAGQCGFERCYEDWRELIADPGVNLVDICAPNGIHREVAEAAAAAGKHIFCEKPLSLSAEEGRAMLTAVESAGVRHMVNFNYRRAPAIAFAKQLLEEGSLGRVYHVRAGFLQDSAADPGAPWNWRFGAATAGGGSLFTMGSHVVDCVRYLVGDYASVVATLDTFVPERPLSGGGTARVDVDDGASILARFQSGAVGMLCSTWLAHGRKHHFEWEINASRGSLAFNSERLNELRICEAADPAERQGFKTIYLGDAHPFGRIFGLKPGMGIGIAETFLLQLAEMVRAITQDSPATPSFYDGWQVDRVLEAAARSSAGDGWVQL